jgi:L-fuconate dehydratase
MATIVDVETIDVRFPTSQSLAGSDAMHPDPDYSAAYVILHTDDPNMPDGHGFTFTIGRGNDICVATIDALAHNVLGRRVEDIVGDLGAFGRALTGDSQLRWIGPEKGVVHLAAAALLNAAWDLAGKLEGKPVWKLLADMRPEQIVSLIDFRHITDSLTPEDALALLRDRLPGRAEREAHALAAGLPAYTTTAGWLGYDDDTLRRLCREVIDEGFDHIKLKVGRDVEDDVRRLRIARETVGPDVTIMVDANQAWEVGQAIEWVKRLAEFDLYWIEEPTSPDDVLGHLAIAKAVAPIKVATGEHCQNRVMFKQFLASGAMGVCQIDSCRVAGVNENVAIMLLAATYGVPVCPHAGGVGLCELVQHLSMFDYIAIGASLDGRVVEFAHHLHEHFVDPAVVSGGRYRVSTVPGYNTTMHAASLAEHRFPDGPVWKELRADG